MLPRCCCGWVWLRLWHGEQAVLLDTPFLSISQLQARCSVLALVWVVYALVLCALEGVVYSAAASACNGYSGGCGQCGSMRAMISGSAHICPGLEISMLAGSLYAGSKGLVYVRQFRRPVSLLGLPRQQPPGMPSTDT